MLKSTMCARSVMAKASFWWVPARASLLSHCGPTRVWPIRFGHVTIRVEPRSLRSRAGELFCAAAKEVPSEERCDGAG